MEEAEIDLASSFEKDQFLQLIADNPFPAIRENALKIINARDFQTATEYFSTIPENGVEMDILLFNALLFKTEYFEQAKEILFTMKDQGISPDEATFNLMSDKASTYEETQWLWEEFKDFDF
ncbi:MAG: hypothetical protein H6562_16220 [Lewinellaceae bacterium]|nr:hypothetical protein [Lewinellaceae bacterium]